jgi:glycosyltransferase involved in cell wall biosynthesis
MNNLTIVIPTINRSTISNTVKSIEDQTIPCEYVIEKDNGLTGCGPTMNRAIAKVKTEYVGFVGDDDTLDPKYVEMFLVENDDCDMFIFKMQYITGRILPEHDNVSSYSLGEVGGSFIIRKSLIEKYPFVRERREKSYHEDWEMIKTLRDNGYKIQVSRSVGYFIRPHTK